MMLRYQRYQYVIESWVYINDIYVYYSDISIIYHILIPQNLDINHQRNWYSCLSKYQWHLRYVIGIHILVILLIFVIETVDVADIW